jgi:TonB family protein
MSRRTWLVSVSIVGHVAIGVGLFASGIWKLERLESDNRLAGIGVMTPSQSMGGSPADLPEPKFKKKEQTEKKIVKDVQWEKRVAKDDSKAKNETKGGTGNGEGDGKGDDKGPGDGKATVGTCVLPPCDGAAVSPIPDPPKVVIKIPVVPPTVLNALRTSGNTQIHPSEGVKVKIKFDQKDKVVGSVKLCIQADGAIGSVSMIQSTGYPEYDQALLSGVRSWRYRPYTVNGVPTPACSPVSFVYSMR